jgi:enoyl-CoA hydratase
MSILNMPMTDYDYEYLDVSLRGPEDDEFWIELDQPEKLNAVNAKMHEELTYVFKDAYESDTRVVVLTGKGEAFCPGGDASEMELHIEDIEVFMDILREGEEILENMINLEKPIVARVQGPCLALGTTLALYCDIVVASENATFGDVHPQMGLVSGDGGAVIWPLLTSLNKAKEFLMTGRTIDAADAEDMGLVNHVVPQEELDEKVAELVDELATLPQYAVRYSKMAANAHLQMAWVLAGRQGLTLEGLSSQVPDHKEANAAFREDREPDYPSARDRDH